MALSRASVTSNWEGSGTCRAKRPSSYGSLWRVDANLQLQEFQQKLVIDGGERRPDDAFVTFSAFELHPDREQRNG
jgi:hypothetical protein